MEIKINKDYTLSNSNLSPILLDIIKTGIDEKELEMLKKKIIEDHQKGIIEYHFEKRNLFLIFSFECLRYYIIL